MIRAALFGGQLFGYIGRTYYTEYYEDEVYICEEKIKHVLMRLKVVITALHQKLKNNKKLMKSAQTDGRQIFEKNIFPQLFDDAAQEAYIESTETYTKLFEDAGKYRAIMGALAHGMLEELQQANR